jgi:hypothetical protein
VIASEVTLSPETSTTRCIVIDIDQDLPGLARRIADDLRAHGLRVHIEKSKSKGYHLWIFFDQTISGIDAQRLARYLNDRFQWVGEYFPRQDSISDSRPYGNFVFWPLYGRSVPEDRTVFLDPVTLDVIPNQLDYLLHVEQTASSVLAKLLAKFKIQEPGPRNGNASHRGSGWVRELLKAKIQTGDRHPTFVSIAGRFLAKGLPAEDVEDVLALVNLAACEPPKSEPDVTEEIHEIVQWVQQQDSSASDDDPAEVPPVALELPAFPTTAWRGPLETWKRATDGTTEAPEGIRFAAILAPLAARIGRRVSLHYGQHLYPNIYAVGFGPTGSMRKTSAARAARRIIPQTVRVIRGVGSG